MSPHTRHQLVVALLLFFIPLEASAITLSSAQTNFTTTSDITIDGVGISSSFSGSSGSLRTITNLNIITTGPSTSDYGIKTTGSYNKITNSSSGQIITSGSSGRGISVSDFSEVYNLGSISTSGITSYGIYAGGNSNTVSNSGSITTTNTTSYGIYLNGNSNTATNSGSINTKVYGINVTGNNNQATNSGIITTTDSSSAHGVFVSSSSSATNNIITNSGTINSRGNGIYTKDSNSTITNSGTISTYDSASIYGIETEGNNATITNSGTITSNNYAIYNSGSNAVINNSGTVNGGIYIGNGTLNILGGTISGAVNGAAKTGSVNIGSDLVTEIFTQSADFTDLNSLTIKQNSTLNAYKNITANNIYLSDNSTFTLYDRFSINAPITGVSSSSGTLNISGTSFLLSNSIGSSSNKIANLNINNGGSFTATNNIYASNIFINNGDFNLDQTDTLTIFGIVSGGGAGKINVAEKNQTIEGNFTLTAGDTLAVTLENRNIGSLTINGTANIDSNSKLAITNSGNGYITNGSNFTILNANSGSTINNINSSNITVNGSSPDNSLLKFTTNTSSNSLNITINRLEAAQVTNNKNAQNIYQNINAIGSAATDELSSFQSFLDNVNLNSSNITDVINQVAPFSTKAMLINNVNIISNAIKPIETRLESGRNNFENGLWIQTLGNYATQKTVKDDAGFNINSFGLVLGADNEINDSNLIGAALSYVQSNIRSANNLETNSVNSYQSNIYHSLNFDKYFINSILGFTFHKYNTEKSISAVNQSSTASFGGQSYNAKITGGFTKKLSEKINLTPIISLKYISNKIDAYNEQGSGSLDLNVQSIKANFLEASAGINFGYIAKVFFFPEFKKIATNFKISYGKNLINDLPTTIANFIGQNSSFNTNISQIDRASLNFETEIIGYHIDDLTFSANYNFEHRETYQSHFLSLKMRQEF
ncbi:MAG: autotransporter domain-containing protein [Rickettsiales bacterium]|nr:autotransporter domain-containing protein [Rickettsiales bacterium]